MHPLLRTLTALTLAGCALNTPNSFADHPQPAPNATPATTASQLGVSAAAALAPTPHLRATLDAPSHAPDPGAVSKTPLRRLPKRDVTHAVALQARRIISAHGKDPFGTEIPFEAGGKNYVARIEQHYHPPGGEKRPWGPHPGVSVFVASSALESRFSAN